MTGRRRILFLSHSAAWNGAERCLFDLIAGLPEHFESFVILPREGPLCERLQQIGVTNHFIPDVNWIRTDFDPAPRLRETLERRVDDVARFIRSEAIDLVFTNTALPVAGALAAAEAGVSHVWRIHEMLGRNGAFHRALPDATFGRLLLQLSDEVSAVSECVRRDLARFLPTERVSVLPNGVAPWNGGRPTKQEAFGFAQDVDTLAFVGSISLAKGALFLPDLVRAVRARFPSVRCVILGSDGGAQDALLERITQLQLEDAFHFLGFRTNVLDLLAACDLLVLPSFVDSLPCVVMEAMAVGLPVIATRSGGAEELITDRETGRLVPIADACALADTVVELLTEPQVRLRLGQAGRTWISEHFSMSAYVDGFTSLFDRLSAVRPPRARAEGLLQRVLEDASSDRGHP